MKFVYVLWHVLTHTSERGHTCRAVPMMRTAVALNMARVLAGCLRDQISARVKSGDLTIEEAQAAFDKAWREAMPQEWTLDA